MKAFSIFIVFLLWGCSAEHTNRSEVQGSTPNPSNTSQAYPGESEEAKALWVSSRVVNYDITMSYKTSGFLEPAGVVVVKVRNATPVSVEVPDRSDERGRLGFYDPYKTVESMFARIESLRARSGSVNVRYNKTYGYPEEIEYSESNPDSSFTFRVIHFQAQPPVANPES